MSRFSDVLLDHAQYPRNMGRIDDADASGVCSLNGHPPYVEFFIKTDDDFIQDIRFDARGCGVTIASCSMITELCEGRSLKEANTFTVDDLISALDGVPPDRNHSPQIAFAAFQNALNNLAR